MDKLCKNCKHWGYRRCGFSAICKHPKLAECCISDPPPLDGAKAETPHEIWTGSNFGCIHWETKAPSPDWPADIEARLRNPEDLTTVIYLSMASAALGDGPEILKLLTQSPSAYLLEPLIVGLRLFLGEEVKVAAVIHEVGQDVAQKITEMQQRHSLDSLQSDRASPESRQGVG